MSTKQMHPTEGKSLAFLFDMPLAFLGFALWRAWVSLTFANPSIPMPVNAEGGHFLYDVILACCALGLAALSKRIAPLADKRVTYAAIAALLGLSTVANAFAVTDPRLVPLLALPSTVAAGIGSTLLILLWCEIYSCLNAARVALYYALALIGGVGLTYLLEGFCADYLYGVLVVLPAFSAGLAHRSYRRFIPYDERPHTSNRSLVPWKFVAVLALFELADGYCEAQVSSSYSSVIGSHSTLATLIGGLVLFAWVWLLSERFPLSTLYRAPVIVLCCGMLIAPLFGLRGTVAGGFIVSFGATLFNAIVFLFLCDISRRFGVSALLLFGLEEATLLFGWVGQEGAHLLDSGAFGPLGPTFGAVAVVVVGIVLAVLVLNEREVGERWGIAFMGKRPPEDTAKTRLARRCVHLAEERQLTAREVEVMELLAAGKSLSGVAQELIIAEGTAKAHTRHIYEKLGINTRQELLDMLVVEEN